MKVGSCSHFCQSDYVPIVFVSFLSSSWKTYLE